MYVITKKSINQKIDEEKVYEDPVDVYENALWILSHNNIPYYLFLCLEDKLVCLLDTKEISAEWSIYLCEEAMKLCNISFDNKIEFAKIILKKYKNKAQTLVVDNFRHRLNFDADYKNAKSEFAIYHMLYTIGSY